MHKRKPRNLPFILSILIHVGLFLVLLYHENIQKNKKAKEMAIEWVEIQDLPKQEISPLKTAQIVQQDDESVNDVTPEKDYKLSKNNQDVLKETKAMKNGEFKNRHNTVDGVQVKNQKSQNTDTSKNTQPKKLALDSFKPDLFDSSFTQEKLAPNPTPARSGSEVSQNDDYLKDVVAGAETLLKTREFVYYSYYNRIKIKLRQHWEPRIKDKIVKIMRQGRRIASNNDKITRLVITLDESGELVRIQVRDASGYNDLDDAAIEAFRAAAPFPNPPKGIVDPKGVVQINWDFVLET